MLCTYRPRSGMADELLALLRAHWPALRSAGLATARPPRLRRATDRLGRAVLVEEFEWRDPASAERAHATPAILALWGPMERLAEEMEFLEVAPLPYARAAGRARPGRSGAAAGRGPSRVGRKRSLAR